ncbi:putative 20S proteasome subunit alpha type 2 [Schizothecium vesticola]|uniref:20S proteasome subunit alpha type 2 n=1 Tax=Schizothecium vesticola TaxID=314040 RepID=A0AA40KB10_9PEZI|nr:putative 20S proteasome subunit alpha type 2 [Schizothecium vesticola]
MCRFLVYQGSDEILLSKLILDPTHSILKQSFDSRLRLDTRRGQNNADGFGIGFYTDPKLGTAPCLFTSTTPAWNCANLHRLASKTASRLIFAHVRATTEGSLSEDNCHPFCHGDLMWMHNGGLGGWKQIKRRLGERLADKWYLGVAGGTDSEWAFALFLDTLERMGYDPSSQPSGGFGPTVLRKAMLKTIAIINELIDAIPESVIHAESIDTRSLLNFALTDGHSVICTRYVGSASDEAASLYYSSGTMWETRAQDPNKRDFQMARNDKDADVVLVASEPLTFERENWVNVPTNSILTVHKQTVMVHPIMDQFYDRNPHHRRSAAYVRNKGLAANEKGSVAGLVQTPVGTPSIEIDAPKKLAPTIPFRTRTSETSTVPRVRTPLSHIEAAPGPKDPGDVRSITEPPAMRAAPQQPPSQGNIKKKRASLSAIEPFSSHLHQDSSPISPEPTRTEFGNPNKIAQYFPELSI